jgi:hypothetical protein
MAAGCFRQQQRVEVISTRLLVRVRFSLTVFSRAWYKSARFDVARNHPPQVTAAGCSGILNTTPELFFQGAFPG